MANGARRGEGVPSEGGLTKENALRRRTAIVSHMLPYKKETTIQKVLTRTGSPLL